MDCIFCKIIHGELPSNKVYENAQIIAFNDLHPRAPVHQLIVPKQHIPTLNDLNEQDTVLIGALVQTARLLAAQAGIAMSGYRTIFNCNTDGGQVIFHVHLHLLGGRPLQWPPG